VERYTEFEKLNDTPEIKFEKLQQKTEPALKLSAQSSNVIFEPFIDAKQLDHPLMDIVINDPRASDG